MKLLHFAVLLACNLPGMVLAQPSVQIAAEDDWAPYASMKADHSGPEGLSPQLVREIFALQGYKVQFITVPFVRCLSYVDQGKVLACFNTTITSDNRHRYYWHKTPLFYEELAIFGRSHQLRGNVTVQQLEGARLGITRGYTYPSSIMNNPRIMRSVSASDHDLLRMLAARRVDYILLNTMPGYLRINQNPAWKGTINRVGVISQDGFWLNFSRARPEGKYMAKLFEDGLQQLKRSGRYDEIMRNFRTRMGVPDLAASNSQ